MDANTSTDKPAQPASIKELIDHFFVCPPDGLIRDELWKWLTFSVSSNGLTMSDLHETEFAKFSGQLSKLIEAVHKWANFQKVFGIQKGEQSHAYTTRSLALSEKESLGLMIAFYGVFCGRLTLTND